MCPSAAPEFLEKDQTIPAWTTEMRINSKRKTGTPDGPHAEKKDLFDLNLAHVFFRTGG